MIYKIIIKTDINQISTKRIPQSIRSRMDPKYDGKPLKETLKEADLHEKQPRKCLIIPPKYKVFNNKCFLDINIVVLGW